VYDFRNQGQRLQSLRKRFARRLEQRGQHDILDWRVRGTGENRRLLVSVVPPDKLSAILSNLFDEEAFLSPHGLRAVSRRHSTPYNVPGLPDATIQYEPAESSTAMYGGNSNWRGPVWFPINYLIIRELLHYDQFLGPDFTLEYPHGSGGRASLRDIAGDLSDRLTGIWLPSAGRRPVYGGVEKFQTDPHGRTTCCSSSTSTATTAPDSAQCTRPDGQPWSRT